jgi:hypothetical protein
VSYRRITISVPEAIAQKALRAAEAGEVESVSAYFAELAAREPDWVEARAALDEMLSSGKPISEQDRGWAKKVLGITARIASSRTADVVDAHVAILGRSLGAVVLTSDPQDLRKLDPDLQLVAL